MPVTSGIRPGATRVCWSSPVTPSAPQPADPAELTPGSAPLVLVVEDEHHIVTLVREALPSPHYRLLHAATGAAARAAVTGTPPDLILLDLSLPDQEGLVLLDELRRHTAAPIIVCSARPRDPDAVLSLRLGAADFVAKPFDLGELTARVETALRRAAPTRAAVPSPHDSAPPSAVPAVLPTAQPLGDVTIDRARRTVSAGGQVLPLTPTEYRLLDHLAQRVDQTVLREDLCHALWGRFDAVTSRSLDAHVARLRAKLPRASGTSAPSIASVRGFGFLLSIGDRAQ